MKHSESTAEASSGDQLSRQAFARPSLTPGDLHRLESLGGLSRWTSLGTLAHLPSLPALGDLYALLDSVSHHPGQLAAPPPAAASSSVAVRRLPQSRTESPCHKAFRYTVQLAFALSSSFYVLHSSAIGTEALKVAPPRLKACWRSDCNKPVSSGGCWQRACGGWRRSACSSQTVVGLEAAVQRRPWRCTCRGLSQHCPPTVPNHFSHPGSLHRDRLAPDEFLSILSGMEDIGVQSCSG